MAAVPLPSPSLSLRDAAESYLAAGMSIIPVIGGGKQPNYHALLLPDGRSVRWEQFQHQRPTPIRLAHWMRLDPDTNLGIVCGAISGNLVVLDVDLPDLANWLLQYGQSILERTWTVRTGSGKLHIYVRSVAPVNSTVVKTARGTKAIDLRGEGEYATAPPSRHPSGGYYETIFGDPTKIAETVDVPATARLLITRFEAHGTLVTVSNGNKTSPNVPEMDHDGKRDLLRRLQGLRVPNRVRRAIVFPATPGADDWIGCPSHSEIDHVICKELRSAGLDRLTIHSIYVSFPIGEPYRSDQANRGYAYLERTLDRADADLSRMKGAAGQAAGENFQVLHALRIMGDPPSYELTIVDTATGEQGKVRISYDDMKSESKFRFAVLQYMPRLLPVLKTVHSGKNWSVFVGVIARMADLEAVPDEATTIGHLRSTILTILSGYRIESLVPSAAGDFVLGWRDNRQKLAYIRGTRLLNDLGLLLRQMPAPDSVWQIMRGLGATQKRVRIGPTSESLWVLPTQSIDIR